jgi:UDPglucose--hexose-1-phosphate uridylyltransferase
VNEIRQNKITKQWVIYAPERGKRPKDIEKSGHEKKQLPPVDETCPFCPGNENMLPRIIMEMPEHYQDGWQTRVVPNKFPALTPEVDTNRYTVGIYIAMPGYGQHEVIIETPRHNQEISEMPANDFRMIIESYHKRYVELMKKHESMMVIIFRNHGIQAGTSLVHPHSQLIVTGIVPNNIRSREDEAQRYFDQWARCIYCDILDFEQKDSRRVIEENKSFLAFIPFAAEVPFETWIVPKIHNADFGNIADQEKSDLVVILRDILSRLYRKLNNPDYNYVIITSARYRAEEPQLHWYVQIRPRLTTPAGFEIGSGISINPSLPEEDTIFLR